MKTISAVATLVTEPALEDFEILLFTLALWNSPKPRLYVLTDSATKLRIVSAVAKYYSGAQVNLKTGLDKYTSLNRTEMERRPGETYATLFGDFTAEKTVLMDWALASEPDGVLFCDADICHLAPLPQLPDSCSLALSPHSIRLGDEAKYGKYNAGYLWIQDPALVVRWRTLCASSRFFEQACLEDLATSVPSEFLYEFPIHVNYGWWRMWQGRLSHTEQQKAWGFFRGTECCGLTVNGSPLQSVHTHWREKKDPPTRAFNEWVLEKLRKLASVKKTKQLLAVLDPRPPQN
jgi:hypothetical protein